MSGPRHPGTEGNDLWPADVKFPDPDGGDGRLSLVNDVAAEFSGLAISSTQPTDMPDGGLWVNLSAEATAVDRLSTFDESTDAFIPIQADSTVVQDSEPAHSKGLIWFDSSPEDGFEMFFSDGDRWYFLQFIPEIPDSAMYWWEPAEFDENGEWFDSVQEEPMSIDGLTETTLSDSSAGVKAENSSNHGSADIMDDIIQSSMSIEFQLQTTDSSEGGVFGGFASGPDDHFYTTLNRETNGNYDEGNIKMIFRDGDRNITKFAFEKAPDINDGSMHTVHVRIDDLETGDVKLFLDGVEKDVEVGAEGADPSNFPDIDQTRFGVLGTHRDDSFEDGIEGSVGIVGIHNDAVDPTL